MRLYDSIQQYSLRWRLLLLFIVASVVPCIIFSVFLLNNVVLEVRAQEYNRAVDSSNLLVQTLETKLKHMEDTLSSLRSNTDVLGMHLDNQKPVMYYDREYQIKTLLTNVSNFIYTDISLLYAASDNSIITNGTTYQPKLAYNSAYSQALLMAGTKKIITIDNFSDIIELPVLMVGMPVFQDSKTIGILYAYTSMSIADVTLNASENGWKIFITDDSDCMVYASDDSTMSTASINLSQVNDNSLITTDDKRFLCVRNDSFTGFHIYLLIPTTVALNVSETLYNNVLILIIIISIEILLFSILVSNIISKDIYKITNAIKDFSDETSPIMLNLNRRDEIGYLGIQLEKMSMRILDLIEDIREKEHIQKILEIQMLKAQINPHMIYNTLNTITYLAQLQNAKNIEEVSNSFIILLRRYTNNTSEYITVKDELKIIKSYINIKKYNLPVPLSLNINCRDEWGGCIIPKFSLQPFVENSIVHGFNNFFASAMINIDINVSDDKLYISIKDNGHGIEKEKLETLQALIREILSSDHTVLPEESIGILNTVTRLKLYYQENFQFQILSDNMSYTSIDIIFPVEYEKGE